MSAATKGSAVGRVRLRKIFGGKGRPLLRELSMSQQEQLVRVEIVVDPAIVPLALWSRSSTSDAWTRHTTFEHAGARHVAVLDLAEFAPTEPVTESDAPDASPARDRMMLHVEV